LKLLVQWSGGGSFFYHDCARDCRGVKEGLERRGAMIQIKKIRSLKEARGLVGVGGWKYFPRLEEKRTMLPILNSKARGGWGLTVNRVRQSSEGRG